MRRYFLAILLLLSGLLAAQKLQLQKFHSAAPLRRHPHTQLLNKQPDLKRKAGEANFNRLLVILVDFEEEVTNDPNTTGNGKFLLEPDPNYLYQLGSPPHDRNYYLQNLEAMRYYYLAASAGSYDLQYEVWPASGAYTLPYPMGWYNPPDGDSDLFVSRMEEYFKTAFELADCQSPELDFSSFGHFMIIHAGSDWQHDIAGDTPSDIPSFFIRVEPGKEAVVDEGSVLIGNACNVPSTISQDFHTQTEGGDTYHSGYGVLNAVLAHEFGHSLGFVDLYNVYTWQPMVGVFDIMDSGGSGILVDVLDDDSYILLEGALPVLPGAWSRELAFGEELRNGGLLVDAQEIDLFKEMSLSASSHKQSGPVQPQILRLPLSPKEYILVENRSVDPDGDGATAILASEDGRVVLHPTAIDDPQNNPTYEYDYFLPSFLKPDASAIGGGILVWRINEDVIYNQGVTGDDGSFYTNFENNSVNTRYSQRGVEIIEADGLPDIGNEYSWYWTGTPYEYFHARKPVLDALGLFMDWGQEEWKPVLNGETDPPLQNSQGQGSLYWLSQIGDPAPVMSLSLRAGWFDESVITDYGIPGLLPGPLINSSFSELDLPLIGNESITLLSHESGEWEDLMGPFAWEGEPSDHPVVSSDQDVNGFRELLLTHGNALEIVDFSSDGLQSKCINYPDRISTAPLALGDTVFVSTATCLSSVVGNVVRDLVQIQQIKRLGAYGGDLATLSQDLLHIVDTRDLTILAEVELPEAFGDYEPVAFTAAESGLRMLFLMANSGNVYKFQDSLLQKIWLNNLPEKPTQMGVTWYADDSAQGAVSPTVFWGCGSRIIAIKHDGTLLQGYPHNAFPLSFTAGEQVYALESNQRVLLYLPVAQRGHVAWLAGEGILWQRSLLTDEAVLGSRLAFAPLDQESRNLFWYYADPGGKLYIHKKTLDIMDHCIHWNGFRNGAVGSFEGQHLYDEIPPSQDFTAFVFPNPVRGSSFRVRIENFDQNVELRLFDINGSLLQSQSLPANGILRRDVALDGGKLASGVYILSLQKGDRRQRIKFAVEK